MRIPENSGQYFLSSLNNFTQTIAGIRREQMTRRASQEIEKARLDYQQALGERTNLYSQQAMTRGSDGRYNYESYPETHMEWANQWWEDYSQTLSPMARQMYEAEFNQSTLRTSQSLQLQSLEWNRERGRSELEQSIQTIWDTPGLSPDRQREQINRSIDIAAGAGYFSSPTEINDVRQATLYEVDFRETRGLAEQLAFNGDIEGAMNYIAGSDLLAPEKNELTRMVRDEAEELQRRREAMHETMMDGLYNEAMQRVLTGDTSFSVTELYGGRYSELSDARRNQIRNVLTSIQNGEGSASQGLPDSEQNRMKLAFERDLRDAQISGDYGRLAEVAANGLEIGELTDTQFRSLLQVENNPIYQAGLEIIEDSNLGDRSGTVRLDYIREFMNNALEPGEGFTPGAVRWGVEEARTVARNMASQRHVSTIAANLRVDTSNGAESANNFAGRVGSFFSNAADSLTRNVAERTLAEIQQGKFMGILDEGENMANLSRLSDVYRTVLENQLSVPDLQLNARISNYNGQPFYVIGDNEIVLRPTAGTTGSGMLEERYFLQDRWQVWIPSADSPDGGVWSDIEDWDDIRRRINLVSQQNREPITGPRPPR